MSSWLGTALSIVSTIGSSAISSKANTSAASTVSASTDRQTDAIREGNQISQQQFEETKQAAKPGVDYLRTVVSSNPNQLTAGQKMALDDARRQTIGAISASGLRGAARTTTAAVNDVERRFNAGAYESNRGRVDNSAARLSTPYFSTANNQATNSAQAGRDEANVLSGSGDADANATTANASQAASSLGALSSFIADEEKAKGRDSRYANKETSAA